MLVKTYSKDDFLWTKWTPREIKPLAEKAILALKRDYEIIKKIEAKERTFENTVIALEKAGHMEAELLSKAGFLMEVSPSKEVREAAHKASEEYSRKIVDVVFDKGIYRALQEYANKKEKLSGERKILFDDFMRGYRRMGFDLPKIKQKKLKNLIRELNKLSILFRKNINDYKDYITLKKDETAGLSERFLSSLKKNKKGEYIVSLDYPEIGPFLINSPNDIKRKEITDKNLQKGGKQNLKLLGRIIKIRAEKAKLLLYKSHAHYVIEERMAKKPETVTKFLNEIVRKIKKNHSAEIELLAEFKRKFTKNKKAKLTYYDGYYSNELKKEKFSVDSERVREYFPFEHVKKGMFELFENLFGVKFEKVTNISLWHEDVELFAIKDGGKIISYFAMDLFPRDGKYGHAAAFDLVVGRVENSKEGAEGGEYYVAPFGSLVCNFTKPTKDNPSLLSHGEVETLFHEFGHMMHFTLTKARFSSQAGFNVAWDFVEAPSQMLENFVWNKKVLAKLTKHYKTGKNMPEELIDNMIKAKNFMVATHYVRQMILSTYDLEVHAKPIRDINEYYRKLAKKMGRIDLPKLQMFPAGFGHIGGGYDAGYYSYAWAESYAQDLWSRFEREGVDNRKVGRDYRSWILEKGSSMEEMDLIKGFLGRAPNNKAFLKHIGVK